MAHLILDGAKEHYILDIEHSDKAIEIIETLIPQYYNLTLFISS